MCICFCSLDTVLEINHNKIIELDGSASYDPDLPDGAQTVGIDFIWSCRQDEQFMTPLTADNPAAHVPSVCGPGNFTALAAHTQGLFSYDIQAEYTALAATLTAEHYYTFQLQTFKDGGRDSLVVTRRVKVLTSAAPVVTIEYVYWHCFQIYIFQCV